MERRADYRLHGVYWQRNTPITELVRQFQKMG